MKNFLNRSIVLTVALAGINIWASDASACTGIRIQPKDGSVIYARTLEFGIDLDCNILVIPRNKAFVGMAPGNRAGLRWHSKYGVTGTNSFDLPVIVDGLNEKGLAVGIFYFPDYTKYQTVAADAIGKALASWELPLFLLGTCANVPEATAAARNVRVSDVRLAAIDFVPAFHYVVHDAAGRCAVLEYVHGELTIHDNPLGVVTNAPTFDWQVTNLCNYVNLTPMNAPTVDISGIKFSGFGQGSGMLGLPGDFTPPSRFVRAVAFAHASPPVATAEEGVLQAFHILNQFDIPKGAARQSAGAKTPADYTSWTSAADLKNLRYYFHTFQNRRIRMIDLKQVNLDAKDIKSISMGQKESIEDLSNLAR
jgi:choloylglycine hydrolase